MEENESKFCSKCGERKLFSEFYKKKCGKYGLQPKCKECCKKSNNKHYKYNDEQLKQKSRKHKEENRDYYLEYNKKYYQKNAEKLVQYQSKYRDDNAEKLSEYRAARKEHKRELDRVYNQNNSSVRRKWRIDNREKVSGYVKKYQKTEKGRINSFKQSATRRALKFNAVSDDWTRKEILDRDNWTCQYCEHWVHDVRRRNEEMSYEELSTKAHIDHILALSRGGADTRENLQVLCGKCNTSKNNRTMGEKNPIN